MIKIRNGLRISDSKPYWLNQMQLFANQFEGSDITQVQFGKQDLRGVPSITLINNRHCVPKQMHFGTSKELLAYLAGYNERLHHDTWTYYTVNKN